MLQNYNYVIVILRIKGVLKKIKLIYYGVLI